MKNFDYVVIGAGIVGLAMADAILREKPEAKVCVIDKESTVAKHASGRNSGVVHAGFYYSPDSLKAKLTRDGNIRMRGFCKENNLRLDQCGKVVVAQDESDLPALKVLHERGIANGVDVDLVDAGALKKLEPLATTVEMALWSPNTAVADPLEVSTRLLQLLVSRGVYFAWNTKVIGAGSGRLSTSNGDFHFGHLINSAGLYSDKIASFLGFGHKYSMIPFIGLYHYAPNLRDSLKRHIYPTPDSRNPFLGVHFTRTVNGDVKVGPTAIPVLSREQYSFFEGFSLPEFTEILRQYPKFLFSKNHNTFGLIASELPKVSRKFLLSKAKKLAPNIDVSLFTLPGKPGIRAQLFDKQQGKLEMDFVIEGDSQSTHILNAVSPGWTSCFSFAEYVIQDMRVRGAI